ncbi:phosphoribosylglycinamide formyltransferase [Dethiobacter alkaliphilus]|uniref:Phosphoribosylglycinamide formyltransferase n=1 Tax=Dethiobacter alkaliphilus AHT 1 TaxID=555088 RepID=C0GHB1_DETAL|nr:phosphoribosylglycinamide formyltransferase [Dethiobacter alkaliphilus]EEG77413.1 phosphoribosylglycinamide formyltransferase [Dethiobacter alkaliphilus AHT 1]
MKRIAVLASGSGSNLQAIMDAIERRDITNAEVAVVISDRKNAYALERARQKSIPVKHQSSKNYQSREEYDRDLVTYLTEQQIDLVVLAGFMRLMTPHFVAAYPNRILNIHPSLLPAFPGAHSVRDALAYGVKVAGCTVHFVDEGMDTGPIILQEAVPVYDSDTEESLHERIHELEHRLYPRAIELWVQDKIKIEGRRCFIND